MAIIVFNVNISAIKATISWVSVSELMETLLSARMEWVHGRMEEDIRLSTELQQ